MPLSYIKEGNNYKYLFNGEWKFSNSGKTIPVSSPVSKKLIGNIQAVSLEEIDDVFKSAKKAYYLWRDVPANKRAEILNKVSDLILKHKEEIAFMLMNEIAKSKSLAFDEIERTVDLIRFTAEEGLRINGEILQSNNFYKYKKNKTAFVNRVPLGVVLAISPFNYPVNLSCSKIAPALISGNSVVLKPGTQGSISAMFVAELFLEAGLPPGVLSVVTGNSSEIGDYLVSHNNTDMIAFTGSTKVGKNITKIAGIKPMLLELGGKDAAVIFSDADIDLAVKECVKGCFEYSGQRCTAIKRIILVDSIAEKFVKKFVNEVSKLKIGNPEDNADICPLINNDAADYIQELVDDANNKGAKKLMCKFREGNFWGPIIYDYVTNKCRIYYEEQFGPFAVIIRVKDEKEAVNVVNDSKYALQADIFTKNIEFAFSIASKIETGTLQINGRSSRGPDNFPFVCINGSGIGTQGVKYSIEAMTRIKSIVFNFKN